jgi:hypothetical protein
MRMAELFKWFLCLNYRKKVEVVVSECCHDVIYALCHMNQLFQMLKLLLVESYDWFLYLTHIVSCLNAYFQNKNFQNYYRGRWNDMPFDDFNWGHFDYNYPIPHDRGHHYADNMYLPHQMPAHYADDMHSTHQRGNTMMI